jgi:hypothetical protein
MSPPALMKLTARAPGDHPCTCLATGEVPNGAMMGSRVMAASVSPSLGQLNRQIFGMEDGEFGDRAGKHDVEPSKPRAPVGLSRGDG